LVDRDKINPLLIISSGREAVFAFRCCKKKSFFCESFVFQKITTTMTTVPQTTALQCTNALRTSGDSNPGFFASLVRLLRFDSTAQRKNLKVVLKRFFPQSFSKTSQTLVGVGGVGVHCS
jgi:hypothetical protein